MSDWLPMGEVNDLRDEALRLPFYDIKLNGEEFKRIHPRSTNEHKDRLEATLGGSIEQVYTFFRLNFENELPRDVVHQDSDLGGYVALLYLTLPEYCRGGTALWRHKETGRTAWPTEHELRREGKSPKREFAKFDNSWRDLSHWECVELATMEFNKLVVFPAECFHSRWPHAAFGKDKLDGRLIWITFFKQGNECLK